MANSDLVGKMWKIPSPYLSKLREKLNNHQGDKHVEGYTRLQNLLQSGKISYENLKNVKHILDKNIKNETIYELNGGKDFHRWINDQLSVARNSIESGKKIQKDVGNQNAYKKPHEKDSTNKGKVRTARLDKSTSSKDIYNNNVNYESVQRSSIKIVISESQYRQLFQESNDIPISPSVINEILKGYIQAALWLEKERLEEDFNSIMGYDDEDDYDYEESEETNELQKLIKMSADINKKSFDSFMAQDMDSNSKIQAYLDIKDFIKSAGMDAINEVLETDGANDLGMDIWLTRNRHGAGFFDRTYDHESELMDAAHKLGEVDLYIGDDLLLYFSNI
jgi:hypothetical protein